MDYLRSEQLVNLHERTGIHAFALFARGHLDDADCAEACETPGALDFIPTVLKKTVQDVIRLFDCHTSSQGVRECFYVFICPTSNSLIVGPLSSDKRPALRSELSETIRKGLRRSTSPFRL